MDNILIGTNGTSYVISDATRDVTINGLAAITTDNLLYMYNSTQDLLYYAPAVGLNLASVSGGDTITIDGSLAVMADTDQLHIQVSVGDLAYDYTIDSDKNVVQNPDYAYRTSPELTVGYTNGAAGTYYFPIPWDTYKHGSMFVTASTGGADQFDYTLWATNKYDVDLATISEDEWNDVTNYLTGAASYNVPISTTSYTAMHFLDTVVSVEYLMVKVTITGGTTNSFGLYTKKTY